MLGPELTLGSITVHEQTSPYVIAEIGVNHEGSLELAKKLILQAKHGGAHAAKFQSYKAGTLASKQSPSYWDLNQEPTTSQYQLFKKYDSFGVDEYNALAEYCNSIGIDFLSTPFDDEAIEYLNPLMPFFKVASADLTNTPFLRKIAACGKPVVLSTGASTLGEIDEAIHTLTSAGCKEVALLHCILNYPTDNENAHLNMIVGLRRAYPSLIIGYSDHTFPDPGMQSLTTAYLLGARIIEKHFTHDKTLQGNDHYHAMDQEDLEQFIRNVQQLRVLLGNTSIKMPSPTEAPARRNARRSIVLAQDVRANTELSEEMLTYKRPGTGISPLHWDAVIGQVVNHELKEDHILQWHDLV